MAASIFLQRMGSDSLLAMDGVLNKKEPVMAREERPKQSHAHSSTYFGLSTPVMRDCFVLVSILRGSFLAMTVD
jgi:hypothetical protein